MPASGAERPRTLRRIYRRVAVAPADGAFEIRLDDRPLRSPAKAPMPIPTAALAEAIAAEWDDQVEVVRPDTMPLTQLVSTAVDRTGPERPAVVAAIAAYAETDLLCHWAPGPASLAARQAAVWRPLLDWAATDLDAPLTVTTALLPVAQPAASLAALREAVARQDDLRLTALQVSTGLLGSLVLGLAQLAGRVTAADAFAAAQLDEDHQAETWGRDAEAVQRAEALRRELTAIDRCLTLLA